MAQPIALQQIIPKKSDWYERSVLGFLFAMQFFHMIEFVIVMPLGPHLMRIFQISTQQFGILVSAYALSASVSGILAAFFTDRLDRKKTLLFVYVGFSLGTFLCAIAPNFYCLLLGRIVAGLFGGLIGSTILAIVGDLIPFERRGSAIGLIMSAFAISSVIGIPLGLKMVSLWEWHTPFFFISMMAVFLVFTGYKILPPIVGHLNRLERKSTWREFILITTNPIYLRAYMLISALTLGNFLIIPYITPYAVFNVNILESDLAWIYFFGGFFSFFSTNLIGRMTDRYGSFPMFIGAVLLSTIPTLLLTHLENVVLPVFILVTTIYMMFSSGRFTPAMHFINSLVDSSHRGAFMNINSSVQQGSLALAAYIAGAIVHKTDDQGLLYYDTVGYLSVLLAILACVLIFPLRKHLIR